MIVSTNRLLEQRLELMEALRRVADLDLAYFNGYVLDGLIPMSAINHARAVLAKVEAQP